MTCDVALLCSDRADTVPGYDFLVNSVWPEMIQAIEERLSYLFNPGNPEVFYEVYVSKRGKSDSLLHRLALASPVTFSRGTASAWSLYGSLSVSAAHKLV